MCNNHNHDEVKNSSIGARIITPFGVSCPKCGGEHPLGTKVCPGYTTTQEDLVVAQRMLVGNPTFMIPDFYLKPSRNS